jgi:hypothetical protein
MCDLPDNDTGFYLKNSVIYILSEANYYIFTASFIYRVVKFRHVGQCNLQAPRSRPYIAKLILQLLMAMISIAKMLEV